MGSFSSVILSKKGGRISCHALFLFIEEGGEGGEGGVWGEGGEGGVWGGWGEGGVS
ncbi:hypothetical protein PCC7424_4400 [Gloeothece citriformis PCC 7424]|uniref:Uncharacterized protein n=1 Tax=Gloeothece citriformis (strain PCC 7424) TaxID=65393 RepID=B7K8Z5_GLOC7|nr:hypothetical protein PCC7424_4400 [Gloeothece citriformis PCC 7424]